MIPIIELIRLEENFRFGTFGVWRINKQVFCVTLEPADLENERNRSSIPAQQYEMKRVVSPRFGETFEICDVPGRSKVLCHPGNKVIDTEGCIILAQHYGKLSGDRAVLNSGDTFKAFMAEMIGINLAHLTIYEHF
ncbi:DUF5675 family protein [uncultured Desulfosarcina sp.]|uniref:DUF5675 family protein n=1 Tax=uncultured Desulfosarcina sp. TaxID=218289 RepID=UPI0029C988F9|nr:DUF5675 family protein [uncultured Desulfosarcina sp.]